jgi:hypothetical protein
MYHIYGYMARAAFISLCMAVLTEEAEVAEASDPKEELDEDAQECPADPGGGH